MTTWKTNHGDEVEVYATAVLCLRTDCTTAHREYRWRVRATNGEIVASGEGHPRRADAIAAAERHHPPVDGES